MSPRSRSELLQDILDFCKEAGGYLDGVSFEEFEKNQQLQRAVERVVELVGEAANQLGSDRPDVDVPWEDVIGMRIMLAHVYPHVDLRELFATVKQDLPGLRRALADATAKKPRRRRDAVD